MFFFSVGLFDWKKDRKFFARFEEPVSPEREYPVEDGDYSLPCSPNLGMFSSAVGPLGLQPSCLLLHCVHEAELGAESFAGLSVRVCVRGGVSDLNADRQRLGTHTTGLIISEPQGPPLAYWTAGLEPSRIAQKKKKNGHKRRRACTRTVSSSPLACKAGGSVAQ